MPAGHSPWKGRPSSLPVAGLESPASGWMIVLGSGIPLIPPPAPSPIGSPWADPGAGIPPAHRQGIRPSNQGKLFPRMA